MANRFSSPIFVLGLPRSGTSMVAGALAACGAWVGATVPASEANPRGFFEHSEIREQVVKVLLRELGADPLGVRQLPAIENLSLPSGYGSLRGKIKKLLQREGYVNSRIWLYKDAKLSLLWPLFAEAFPAARWVIVRRDQEAFIDSCLRTSFMRQHSQEPDFWRSLHRQYSERLKQLKAGQRQVYILRAEELARGDHDKFAALCRALGLSYDANRVAQFVDPALITQSAAN